MFKLRGRGNPAVVLLDLKLPKVDGLEVLEQLKSDPELQAIPVVMLTSSREEQDLTRSYKLGVNAYVVKPVEFVQFVDSIKELGLFWAVINEPPPGSVTTRAARTTRQSGWDRVRREPWEQAPTAFENAKRIGGALAGGGAAGYQRPGGNRGCGPPLDRLLRSRHFLRRPRACDVGGARGDPEDDN